jgi:hypothetical protein
VRLAQKIPAVRVDSDVGSSGCLVRGSTADLTGDDGLFKQLALPGRADGGGGVWALDLGGLPWPGPAPSRFRFQRPTG